MLASLPPVLTSPANTFSSPARDTNSTGWNAGNLHHLIPISNHEKFLIKASFKEALKQRPLLKIDQRFVSSLRSDSHGYFWQFYVGKLDANRQYELQLTSSQRRALCDPWPLKTFPHPDEHIENCRILAYTCAGGNEDILLEDASRFFFTYC
jgi:hypothetical protein